MPNPRPSLRRRLTGCAGVVVLSVSLGTVRPCPAEDPQPAECLAIRSREIELQYRLVDTDPGTAIDLWYTRDRGVTWHHGGRHVDHGKPFGFLAPAEGLYGLVLELAANDESGVPKPPSGDARPQRWVFVDYTPPLVQWESVEPADAFVARRVLHLRWTAHDDHLSSRPVTLSYQTSIDQTWKVMDAPLPNTGRYDWRVPVEVAGQLTLRIAVRDQGGHEVQRLHGPISIEELMTRSLPEASTSTRPATEADPQATGPNAPARPVMLDIDQQRKAEQLYLQGSWHLVRGQNAVAAERFREALAINPGMLEALNDLAGIHYLEKDYERAVEYYRSVLEQDAGHAKALHGAALAYVAQRRYPQSRDMLMQLLEQDDSNAEAWLDLGDVLFMMGDQDGALERWERAMRAVGAAPPDAASRGLLDKARRRLQLYRPQEEGQDQVVDRSQ